MRLKERNIQRALRGTLGKRGRDDESENDYDDEEESYGDENG